MHFNFLQSFVVGKQKGPLTNRLLHSSSFKGPSQTKICCNSGIYQNNNNDTRLVACFPEQPV